MREALLCDRLIALGLSPFTAPFAVVDLNQLLRRDVPRSRPVAPLRKDELQTWLVDGEAILDLPMVPMATEVKQTATAVLTPSEVSSNEVLIPPHPPLVRLKPADGPTIVAVLRL